MYSFLTLSTFVVHKNINRLKVCFASVSNHIIFFGMRRCLLLCRNFKSCVAGVGDGDGGWWFLPLVEGQLFKD